MNPDYDFEFHFLDTTIEGLYKAEQRVGRIIGYFTVLAIAIACLGLLGLVSLITDQRKKEVGIRKVLGASLGWVLVLLIEEFAKWVVVSNLIAWPVAYVVLHRLLRNYAYRISIGFDIFVISGLMALAVAFLTVSFQVIRAARSNPVEALRIE